MVKKNKKYYEVVAKCGHVGRTNCIMIHFAVRAETKKDAAGQVKEYKRVKRNHKDCIQTVTEINFLQYVTLKADNLSDPYLRCKSKWQQNLIKGLKDRIEADAYNIARKTPKTDKKESREYRQKRQNIIVKSLDKEIYACEA